MKVSRSYLIVLVTSIPILALDLWTKNIAETYFIHEGRSVQVASWFNFALIYNYAAAFGMFSGFPAMFRKVFLLLLVPAVLTTIWFTVVKKFRDNEITRPIAMGLVFGGALGNMFDRLIDGRVTDFVDWYYPSTGDCLPQFYHATATTCHWPAFNLADSAILIAVILLCFHSMKSRENKEV